MPGHAAEIYAPEFERRFKDLPPDAQFRIIDAIRLLGRSWSRPNIIAGRAAQSFRLRVGDYRVVEMSLLAEPSYDRL